ncbi:MAG: hypothetical protein Q8N81_00630, partial [bacterium]|nr:hypothetical protein [bacterium]
MIAIDQFCQISTLASIEVETYFFARSAMIFCHPVSSFSSLLKLLPKAHDKQVRKIDMTITPLFTVSAALPGMTLLPRGL